MKTLREIFAEDVCKLMMMGDDFCIARVIKNDDTGEYYIDYSLFWSWQLSNHKDIDAGFVEANYEEVCEEGYYLFTTNTEYEYIQEDNYVDRKEYWTYPDKFIKMVPLSDVDGFDEPFELGM